MIDSPLYVSNNGHTNEHEGVGMSENIKVVSTGLVKMLDEGTCYYIDKETGEVVLEESLKRLPVHRVDKYVGIDTKWLSDCVTEDQFKETLGVIDGWASYPVKISHEVISKFLLEGAFTVREGKVLMDVIKRIVGWNIAVTSVKEISESTDISVQNVSKCLRNLSPSFARVGSPSRGVLIIRVNPVIAWKGGSVFREEELKTWWGV